MKFIRLTLSLVIAFICSQTLFAQNLVNSPYSSYGIGELGGLDHAVFGGLGNATATFIDSNSLNYYNPASYGFLATYKPLFTTGLSSRFSTYKESDRTSTSIMTSVQHFAMGFPMTKYGGLAVGLKPYASRGYEFVDGESVGSDSIRYTYSGSGTINEVFIGLSGNVIKMDNTKLSLGANFGYLFGSVNNTRKSSVVETAGNLNGGVDTKITTLNDLHLEFGSYFEQKINKMGSTQTFGLAVVADPSQKLTGRFTNSLYYAGNVNNPNTYDTLVESYFKDTLISASKLTFGLRYGIVLLENDSSKNRRLNSSITLHASYTLEDWSTYSNPFSSTDMASAYRLNIGIEYTPEIMLALKYKTAKFYEKLHYRAGVYQISLPYLVNDLQLKESGYTFGLGLPIGINSSFNAAFSYGNRSTSDSNLHSESYYGINIGITIAPIGDIWFRKPKLN